MLSAEAQLMYIVHVESNPIKSCCSGLHGQPVLLVLDVVPLKLVALA